MYRAEVVRCAGCARLMPSEESEIAPDGPRCFACTVSLQVGQHASVVDARRARGRAAESFLFGVVFSFGRAFALLAGAAAGGVGLALLGCYGLVPLGASDARFCGSKNGVGLVEVELVVGGALGLVAAALAVYARPRRWLLARLRLRRRKSL